MNHLDVMSEAAKLAAPILKKYFGEVLEYEEKKNASDIRSHADTEAEAVIVEHLKKHFPDYGIFAEESGKYQEGAEYCFIVDPLDGTNNFSLGIPFFSTAIALMHKHDVIAAVTHLPLTGDVYMAEKGRGATHNHKPLCVSDETETKRLTGALELGYHNAADQQHIYFSALAPHVKRMWLGWSPSLDFALLAAGKIEFIYGNSIELYDVAGGLLLAQEAGATVHIMNEGGVLKDDGNVFLIACSEKVRNTVDSLLKAER